MNLFELNAQLAVKLNQSFDSLYNLEFLEYSLLINVLKKQAKEKEYNPLQEINELAGYSLPSVNLPDNLKIR